MFVRAIHQTYTTKLSPASKRAFGLYRATQTGATLMDPQHRHTMLYSKASTCDARTDADVYKDVRSYDAGFKLQDPSLLAGRAEFEDGITLVILSIFPNVVIQQIVNTLAVRQINPHKVDGFELVWTHFGYADDDLDLRDIRIKQSNLIGPAGLISMEDGEAVEIVQRAIVRDGAKTSYIAMGGGRAEDSAHLVTEASIIGFWDHYKAIMNIEDVR